MEQPNYECLPQRAPRQKRKRPEVTIERSENASDDGNAAVALKNGITTAPAGATEGAPRPKDDEGDAIKENEGYEDTAPSEAGSEPAEYRACAVPGHKFECKLIGEFLMHSTPFFLKTVII